MNAPIIRPPQGNRIQSSPRWLALTALAAGMALLLAGPPAARAVGWYVAPHNVAAGNLTVSQYPGWTSGDDNTNCVVALSLSVNDFRIGGYSRGDYNVQVGSDGTDDSDLGVLISSVAQNVRTNYLSATNSTFFTNSYCTSAIETNSNGSYRITSYGHNQGPECNVNVAGAWFPYSSWIGGHARTTPYLNGGSNNLLTGSAGLKNWNDGAAYTNFFDIRGMTGLSASNGQFIVSLTNFGIDSRYDGVLLVNHGKDEANHALSQVNSNNGTWNVFIQDNGGNGAEYEQDPVAFVFIPRTNTTVVSGRFKSEKSTTPATVTIDMYSDTSPQFTVTSIADGRWFLKMNNSDYTPTNGVLILSLEGGYSYNQDNIVTYVPTNYSGNAGWEINSRDLPNGGLQTPAAGAPDAVCSFVYIPANKPGFTVTPTSYPLQTTKSGGTATFTVVLDRQPYANVTVGVSSSNTGQGTVSPSTLTFTASNWDTPQTVTVTGADDNNNQVGSTAYTIVLAAASSTDARYNGLNPDDVAVVNSAAHVCDYQYGVNGYTGAVDVEISPGAKDTTYPTGTSANQMWIDYDTTPTNREVLLAFTNIFGSGAGQIPAGATIVSATLDLFVTDSGNGALLYRMLRSWDPNTETWNTLGNGVQTDNTDACSTNASFWGIKETGSGEGHCVFSVTTDLQVWANGAANYGWVMTSMVDGGNGVAWRPCEWTTASERPRLHVVWLPPGTQMAGFQQGVNGYASARDTSIRENEPSTSHATWTGIWSDWAVSLKSDNEQSLIRFDDIIGDAAGQIPSGATVYAAVLDLTGDFNNAPGDGGLFHALLQSWQDTDTWSSLGGIQADGTKAATQPSASAGCADRAPNVQATVNTFDLTTDVQAWVNGTRANYGWAVLPWTDGGDGWGFDTAEATTARVRPQLRVYYTDNFLTNTWSPGGSLTCSVTNAAGTPGAGYSSLYMAGHLDIQATAGNPYTIQLTSYSGDTPGPAANWSCDSSYAWTIATPTRGVLNFDVAKFAVGTSQFANDLAGGTFAVTTSGDNLQVAFAPNHAPVAGAVSYSFAKGVSFKPFSIPIATFLASNTSDADGDARALVSVTSTNAIVSTNATDITLCSTNGVAESIEYVVRDVRDYRAGDTLRMATNYIQILRTNSVSVGTATISNLGGTNMTISFYGIPDYNYVIQRSCLDLSSWVDVITNAAASDGRLEYTETPPNGCNPAFYRIRSE